MRQIGQRAARITTAAVVILTATALTAPSAIAGLCFTSGKVYVQQKVWEKAARFLECARREEPENLQLYGLLGISRVQLHQYRSAGAAFQIGMQMATQKKDEKRVKEMRQNRDAALAGLYNKGLAAMSRAGKVDLVTVRTTDAGTPQAKTEQDKGAPNDFGRWSEGGGNHEVWYYAADKSAYYFPPTGEDPVALKLTPFGGPNLDMQFAVADSTAFPDYEGASKMLEAVYNFELAAMIDPQSVDTYKNLSYLYERVGRIDDAIGAAKTGLALKPGDEMLIRNLRAAAMGRANRLFVDNKFKESVPAYWVAMEVDSSSRVVILDRIGEAWLRYAEPLPKDSAERKAAFDSASVNYLLLYETAPAESHDEKQNSIFNAAVIATRVDDYKAAAKLLDKGLGSYPNNKELQSLAGQTKFQAEDYKGAIENLRKAVELDAKDYTNHQFLFLSYVKTGNKEASAAEYAMYKALKEGKQRTGNDLKVWIDAAANRLGPGQKCTATMTAEGYPDEVYSYSDEGKQFESWFYWTKGKSITFMDGQVFSQGAFPAQKVASN